MDWFQSVLLWLRGNRVFNKVLLRSTISVLFLGVSSSFAFAQSSITCPDGQIMSDLGCIPDDPVGFVGKFYGWGLGIIGFVAIIFMIIGGYYLMTSQGDPMRLGKAKSFIIYSIAGLLLAIFGFVLVQFVARDVLNIPGF